MPPTSRGPVNQARAQLQAAQINLGDALFDEEAATMAVEEARRSMSGAELDPFLDDLTSATERVQTARLAVSQGRLAVLAEIGTWVGSGGTKTDVDADIARLETTTPIVLFPVRLEARFQLVGPQVLKLRIYPDEIFLNTHEYALTLEEQQAGVDYWNPLKGPTDTAARWQNLISQVPGPRAAYVARATRPTHDAPYGGCMPYPSYIPGAGELSMSPLPNRSDVWTRAGDAVLPDRWVVVAYRKGKEPKITVGRPIPEPLPITPNPNVAPGDVIDLGNDFKIDKDIAWTVDFDHAVSVGMAVNIDLEPDEAVVGSGGFDRIVVVGVKSSLGRLETSGLIENLFDAHHYTRGLALVPQGTPTNNTTGKSTPFPPHDPHGTLSFPIERQPIPPDLGNSHQVPAFDTSGARSPADFDHLAQALGVPNSVFQNVEGARNLEQYRAQAMNQALWPATLGYFANQMMRPTFVLSPPVITKEAIQQAGGYFARWVRGSGPVPVFRIGSVPYGVLPIVSFTRWQQRSFDIDNEDADEELESKMVRVLRRLREIWKQGRRPQTIKPGTVNPLDPLAELLSEEASSTTIRLRDQTGGATLWNAGTGLGIDMAQFLVNPSVTAESVMAQVGLPNLNPRVLNMVFKDKSSIFEGAFAEVGGTAKTASTYINELATASLAALWDDTVYGPGQKPLLYLLLRHALLLEYIRVARELNPTFYNTKKGQLWEPEIWQGVFSFFRPARQFLEGTPPEGGGPMFQQAAAAMGPNGGHAYLPAFERLAAAPPEELARLLSESLDAGVHRLDAWITAYATHRLATLRGAQIEDCQKPIGNYLGGYGWVEDIRPSGGASLNEGGFIHAPSQAHANAAAILRCGFSAYKHQAQNKYAIDLSSERARRAQRLVEEVRAGQTLGAALGYRFERGLHENHDIAGIDTFIYHFRNLFPQVANQSGLDPFDKVETVAARNVVDGLKLVRGVDDLDFVSDPKLPHPPSPAFVAVETEINRLKELFDAVSDLINAEAVYQMASGDIPSAQANVDFLPEGKNAPETELARVERGGVGVTHRVMMLLTPTVNAQQEELPPALPAGWPEMRPRQGVEILHERSRAEPFIDAWVGHRIGPGSSVKAIVRYKDGDGDDQSYEVTLEQLGLRPLDLLAIAQDETLPNVDQELERRILAAPAPGGTLTDIKIDFAVSGDGILSFPQVMEAARALATVLGAARPVVAADLVTPLEIENLDNRGPGEAAFELKQRANAAYAALEDAKNNLAAAADRATQRTRLDEAARFIAGAFPPKLLPVAADETAQMAQAKEVVLAELTRRFKLGREILDREPIDDGQAEAGFLTRKGTDLLKAVFGQNFFALPAAGFMTGTHAAELALSLQARATLLGIGQLDIPLPESAPVRFMQQVALVRDGARRWRSLSIYARALGGKADRLEVLQVPHVPGEAWAGRAVPPAPGRVSLLAYSPAEFPPLNLDRNLRGIFLDDWVESIPRSTQETAVAFHYDHPNAEAPQAVLVAVPARVGSNWQFDDVLAAVKETFELTDVRSINPESLSISSLVPSPSLVFAPNRDSVSTDFSGNKVQDVHVRGTRPVPGGTP